MRYKILGISVLAVLGILAMGMAILAANLPFVAQKVIEQRFGQVLAMQNLGFTVSHVGLTRTLVSDLEWGKDITADLADVSYAIDGFKMPVPGRLILSGLQIKALYDSKRGMVIDGVFLGTAPPPLPDGSGSAASRAPGASAGTLKKMLEPYLPFLPEQVIVNSGNLSLTLEDKTIQIPFDLTLSLNKTHGVAECVANLHPLGQPVTITSRIDLSAGLETFRLEARAFNPGLLAAFLPLDIGRGMSGSTDLTLEKRSHNNWQVTLAGAGLALSGPDGLQISRATARILKHENQVTVLGQLGLFHPVFDSLAVSGRALWTLDASGSGIQGIELACETQPMDRLTLNQGKVSAGLERPQAALSMQIQDQAVTGSLQVSFMETVIRREESMISLGQGMVKSNIQGDIDNGTLIFDLTSQLSRILVDTPGEKVRFNRMDTAGTVSVDINHRFEVVPRVALTTELISGSITVPAKKIDVQGIWARLPVTFPAAGGTGRFSVDKLMIDNRAYLTGEGSISRSKETQIQFEGTFQVPDTGDLSIGFKGSAGLSPGPRLKVEAVSNRFRFSPFRFEKLMPRAGWSADYDLELSAAGTVLWENHMLTTGGDLTIHDGTLSLPDLNLKASGIRGRVSFQDLLAPASVPGQMLTVERIQAGDFSATDAQVRFTLEPGPSLVLENVRLNWAGGLVTTESIRFPSPDRAAAVTFYCDRIQLDRLLAQIGGFETQGKGSLNGRIPVIFKDGEISFDNAFLFSTPGQGGRIIIHNTQKLLAGIPMDSPQFTQLDLAKEALQDFEYAWAKLIFNTRADTLVVNMELDGKPARLLPFVYKKEVGAFVRVDAQSPGSHFQGIKLDVNLTLPFNQVVRFGNKIQKLLK
jgi:hypothetical protein